MIRLTPMDTKDAGRKGGLTKWAKVRSKRERSEIMKRVRRGKKLSKPQSSRGHGDGKPSKDAGS